MNTIANGNHIVIIQPIYSIIIKKNDDKNKDKPFFLFDPTVLSHGKLAGPEHEFYKMYEHAFEETRHGGNDYGSNATVSG